MAENTAVSTQGKQEMNTQLSYYTNQYIGLMERDFAEHGLVFNDYSKQCVMASMSAIYNLVTSSKAAMSNLNGSNLRQIIGQVSSLQLNANAVPRECIVSVPFDSHFYFLVPISICILFASQLEVEMGIEGDGNDALLRNFGVDVKKVYPVWLVKEGDDFTYPKHKGIKLHRRNGKKKDFHRKLSVSFYRLLQVRKSHSEDYCEHEQKGFLLRFRALLSYIQLSHLSFPPGKQHAMMQRKQKRKLSQKRKMKF